MSSFKRWKRSKLTGENEKYINLNKEERVSRQDKVEKLREENQKLILKHREKEEEIKDLEKTKEMMNNFSKAKIEDIRRQRDKLLTEGQKLDEEIIRLNKEADNTKKHYDNHMKTMEGKVTMLEHEFNDILQKINKNNTDDQSEDQEKKEKDEQADQKEHKKAEKLRPVKFSQVEAAAIDINRRLTLRRIPIEEAFEYLIMVVDEKDFNPKETMLKTLNSNLHKEPFNLSKENSKLMARYLIEDNFEETVEFDAQRTQSKVTVKSIFKTMVGPVRVRELDELKKLYSEIHSAVNANRNGISLKLQDKEKRDTVPISKFIEEIRGATETLLRLNEDQKNFMIITMVERAEGAKEVKIENIFTYFSNKEFEEMYLSSGHNMGSSRKGGHKKTFTNSIKQISKRDSYSEMSDDAKRTESKGQTVVNPSTGHKNKQSHVVTDFGNGLGRSQSQTQHPIKEESQPKDRSDDLSDDISRDSDSGPPPMLAVNEVKTFNNPEVKEKIYTLEQVKAAGHVKNAFGSLMFGAKKPDGPQTESKDKQVDKTDKQPAPLEFMLIKKTTYQDSNKIDPKIGSIVETMGKKYEQKPVPETDKIHLENDKKPAEPNIKAALDQNKDSKPQPTTQPPGQTSSNTTSKPQEKPAEPIKPEIPKTEEKNGGIGKPSKPGEETKQKQPLIIDDSDDYLDEDDEIDRMLAENQDRDDF